jgi:hypothetical protein
MEKNELGMYKINFEKEKQKKIIREAKNSDSFKIRNSICSEIQKKFFYIVNKM